MPKRIQLRRTKGWRKPEGAVVVARPTKWGNPHDWREYLENAPADVLWTAEERHQWARERAVEAYREDAMERTPLWHEMTRRLLGGKDLACWCPPHQPCHADVLLEIANKGER